MRVTHCLHTLISKGILIGYHMTSNGCHSYMYREMNEGRDKGRGRREGKEGKGRIGNGGKEGGENEVKEECGKKGREGGRGKGKEVTYAVMIV